MKRTIVFFILSILIPLFAFYSCDSSTENQGEPPIANDLPLITTYYWDGDWEEHASWSISDLGEDLTIDIDAWNWMPEFSQFRMGFDNIFVYGDIDPITDSNGLLDNFDDGIIDDMWNVSTSEGAQVFELNGVLNIDIPAGTTSQGWNQVGGLITRQYVIHGAFDIRVDFEVCPDFHSTPNCNVKLFLTDKNGKSLEISIRSGRYESREIFSQGGSGVTIAWTHTDHLEGKLRISRTYPTNKY